MSEGGPWTWTSRTDKSLKSCLDLVIISSNLLPYATRMKVDKEQEFSGMKVGMARGSRKVTKWDHFPIIVMLEKMPKAKMKIQKESRLNLNKEGCWETHKSVMEEKAEELEAVVEDKDLSEEEVVKKFDSVANKAKFKAFGNSKPMTARAEARRLEDKLKAAQGLDKEFV